MLQATVVALGAVPLFALARRRRLGDWLGLVFAVAWLLNPTIQAANWLEFHPVTLAPTFLMAAFYFLVAGRGVRGAGLPSLPSWPPAARRRSACLSLLVAMMGLYAGASSGGALGLITLVLALGWSLLAVLGIQAFLPAATSTGAATPTWARRRGQADHADHAAGPGPGAVAGGERLALLL